MSRSNTTRKLRPTPTEARLNLRPAKRVRGAYRLTRGGAICFGAIGVIALASLNTGNNLLFMILAVLAAGMVISAVISRVILSGIQIDLAFPQRVFARDRIHVPMAIHNARRRLPAYAIGIRSPEGCAGARAGEQPTMCAAFAPYVPPQGSLHFEASFTFQRRGLYPTISLEVISHFPFGVLRRKQTLYAEEAILVFPVRVHADAVQQSVNVFGGGDENGQRGSSGDLYAIRPYHTGDPAKHIDWKATARTGEIKVREFTREAAPKIDIFLDCELRAPLDGAARARFERAVSFCASIACEALRNHASLQFAATGVRTKSGQGEPGLDTVLAVLALIEPAAAGKAEDAPLDVTFAESIPLVVTDRPGDPIFSAAAAAGLVISMSDVREADAPPKR